MKKVIAWLLVLALTAAVSIGATLAYLTDTDEDVNVMTLGKVKIDQLEYERVDVETEDEDADVQEFHDNKPLLPAVTDKDFTYTPGDSYVNWDQIGKDGYTSDIWDPTKINNEVDKMVFVKNKGDWDAYVRTVFAFEAGNYTTLDEFNAKMHLNLNTTDFTWEWVETPMDIGEGTYFVAVATYNKVLTPGALTEISLSQIALDKTATNDDVAAFGDTYQVLVQSQAVQADGFDDPDTALNEAFGKIGSDATPPTPFPDDNPTKGIDLRTALHYLDGNPSGTKITNSISKVVYALNSEYPEIVNEEKGTLVDVEQDVDVYAYYVEQNGTYTVYFLANDTIYSPANSADLYANMGALVEVDTHNYDVSRVETMSNMFLNCKNLAVMDTSDWDTGNVTTMFQTFRNCNALVVEVGGWDVSKVTNMYGMFVYNYALTELDVSQWQVGNVEDMGAMFGHCFDLAYLDVSKWDTGSVKSFRAMFQGNIFKGNMKIKELDVSNWDTSNVTDIGWMFLSCAQLEELDVSNWDVSNVTVAANVFCDCYSLQNLDLSKWDTSKFERTDHMFYDCRSMTTIYVGDGWDMSNVGNSGSMFGKCSSLQGGNGSTLEQLVNTDKTYACVDTAQTPGYLTYKAGKGSDLRTALHYLGGNPYGTMITNNISKVVYALNSEYPAIVNGGNGTLVDVEQDVDVHAYYVEQNGTYTVYFLADNTIYSPANSADLYANMGALVKVDTHNYDVSRVETMANMFLNCKNLAVMDTSDWDTSNVTTMFQTFRNCNALVVEVGGWDVSKVTNMYGMFVYNYALTELDVSQWQVGNVEDMGAMFGHCFDLAYLDVSKWDTGSVKSFKAMFQGKSNQGNMKISNLDVSNWDTSSCTIMNHMFYSCGQLTELDLSGWDVSNVVTMSHMFSDCFALQSVDFTGWNTSALTSMDAMFNDCRALKVVDVSDFDTATVQEFSQIFEACYSLEQIIGLDKWDTSSGTVFDEMFSLAGSLKELDLSSFDTSSAKYSNVLQNGETNYHGYGSMFSGCNNLTKLTLGAGFVFSGDGSIPNTHYPKFPSPAAIDEQVTVWYNAENDTYYTASEIPEKTAATYVAAVAPSNP